MTEEPRFLSVFRAVIFFVVTLSQSRDGDDNDLIFSMAFNKDHLMYAHCAAEPVNPASLSFE